MKRAVAAEAAKVVLWTAFLYFTMALVALLAARTSFAAGDALATADAASAAAAGAAPPQSSARLSVPPNGDLEARLRDAQERLRRDAQQVAALSSQLGLRAMRQAIVVRTEGPEGLTNLFYYRRFRRGVVGLLLAVPGGSSGARVLEVSPGGPADDAGVRPGDVIVAVNGAKISGHDTARQVLERLRRAPPGSTVELRVLRGGKGRELGLKTRPARWYTYPGMRAQVAVRVPPMPRGGPGAVMAAPPFPGLPDFPMMSAETAGMQLVTLTPTLGTYFGTDRGVLVLRVPVHDVFRLEEGDVIVSIGGRQPQNGAHATRILSTYGPGERLVLRIMRHRKPMTLSVTLPGSPPS